MQEIFGFSWSSQIQNDFVFESKLHDWDIELADICNKQIKYAIDRCRTEDLWRDNKNQRRAPTLQEFKKLCRSYRDESILSHEISTTRDFCRGAATEVAGNEIKSFKDHLNDFREKCASVKISHPIWDFSKTDLNSRSFDEKIYKERRAYLLSLNEFQAYSLCPVDKYDRLKFLGEEEGMRIVMFHKQKREQKKLSEVYKK